MSILVRIETASGTFAARSQWVVTSATTGKVSSRSTYCCHEGISVYGYLTAFRSAMLLEVVPALLIAGSKHHIALVIDLEV